MKTSARFALSFKEFVSESVLIGWNIASLNLYSTCIFSQELLVTYYLLFDDF